MMNGRPIGLSLAGIAAICALAAIALAITALRTC